MARTSPNAGLRNLSGSIDRWVYKQYRYGTVVTRQPDMSGVKASARQIAHREHVRRAGEFYRKEVLSNPALLARFTAIARRKGIPVSAVSFAEYMKSVRPRAADCAEAGRQTNAVRLRFPASSTPEPELERFMAGHRALQRAYEKLSKRELVQILMRAELKAARRGT